MAQQVGGLIREKRGVDKRGRPVRRFGFYVWKNAADGSRVRKRLYSYPDDLGKKVPFPTEATAKRHLTSVQQKIAGGATVEAAIAPYLADSEDLGVLALWSRFVDSHERATRDNARPITAKRLVELRRMPTRGYLDFFAGVAVTDLTSPLLVQWLGWLRQHWPAPPPGSPTAGRIKPTADQLAQGIRGFHRAKTRHHVMNDFLQFDGWLVSEGLVHPREHVLQKPPSMPPLPKGRQPVPDADTVARYLAAIPEELRGLFLSRSVDGLRPSEARRMTLANYDFATGLLSIDPDQTKTEKGAGTFQLDWELRDWLDAWIPRDQRLNRSRPLFLNPRCWLPCSVARERVRAEKRGLPAPVITGHWTAGAEKSVHDAACREIGVYFQPNIFGRHAAGTHMLLRSQEEHGHADVRAVQEKLRHESPTTTDRYLQRGVIRTATIDRIRPGTGKRRDAADGTD